MPVWALRLVPITDQRTLCAVPAGLKLELNASVPPFGTDALAGFIAMPVGAGSASFSPSTTSEGGLVTSCPAAALLAVTTSLFPTSAAAGI